MAIHTNGRCATKGLLRRAGDWGNAPPSSAAPAYESPAAKTPPSSPPSFSLLSVFLVSWSLFHARWYRASMIFVAAGLTASTSSRWHLHHRVDDATKSPTPAELQPVRARMGRERKQAYMRSSHSHALGQDARCGLPAGFRAIRLPGVQPPPPPRFLTADGQQCITC